MKEIKSIILNNICYTDLVYGRINKKLKTNHSNPTIETLLKHAIQLTDVPIEKKGKNFYITCREENFIVTVNSSTYRVITVNPID